jgi:hypothetical protein
VNPSEEIRSNSAQDAATESAVLQQVLALHPTVVTIAELIRELGDEGGQPANGDTVERAIRDLTGAGLLHRNESFVLPTRAALRFDELLGE